MHTLLIVLIAAPAALAAAEPVPLLFASVGETLTAEGRLRDLGPLGLHAELGKAGLVAGRTGKAVAGGADGGLAVQGDLLDNLGVAFTATCWLRVEALPAEGNHWLVGKGGNAGWQIGL